MKLVEFFKPQQMCVCVGLCDLVNVVGSSIVGGQLRETHKAFGVFCAGGFSVKKYVLKIHTKTV